MEMSEQRLRAKSMANSIIESQNLKAPFSIASVSKTYGIDVYIASEQEIQSKIMSSLSKLTSSEDVIGFYDKNNQKFYVSENTNSSLARQRFTVAHELGHHVLGHNNSFRIINKKDLYDFQDKKEEVEANYFASYFLVPDEDLKKLKPFFEFYPSGLLIAKLADSFILSIEAMRIRLKLFYEEYPEYEKNG